VSVSLTLEARCRFEDFLFDDCVNSFGGGLFKCRIACLELWGMVEVLEMKGLHAPDVTANLILISWFDLTGWNVVFGRKNAHFFKDKKEIFGGTLKNGLYLIGGSFISNIPVALTAWFLWTPGDIMLWHQGFSHFGINWIIEASKLVNGLEITSKDVIGKCKDCIIRNQKRHPYDKEITPETEVLQLTNIDIWGPAHVQSAGGAFYAMKFHDSGSSHCRPFFLKDCTAETVVNSLKIYKL
jgi:hypothetical protein